MPGRTRNMAADAAHLAGLGAGPSGSASGHRAHRRLRAEQGRAASGALDDRAPGLGAAQVLVEARHDLHEWAGIQDRPTREPRCCNQSTEKNSIVGGELMDIPNWN